MVRVLELTLVQMCGHDPRSGPGLNVRVRMRWRGFFSVLDAYGWFCRLDRREFFGWGGGGGGCGVEVMSRIR